MFGPNWLARGAVEIAHAIRTRQCTASDILDAQYTVIDRLEPRHHVFITETRDRAHEQAAAIDAALLRGETVGPLAGVPLAIKDIFDIDCLPTTAAMPIHQHTVASRDRRSRGACNGRAQYCWAS